jgi:hypothetical protein
MKTPCCFLAAIALAGTIGATGTTVVSNDLLAKGATDALSPASSTDATSGLRDLALTLSSGSDAIRSLRGSGSNHDEKYTINVSIPNMDCSMDRIANFISCYSDTLGSEKDAKAILKRYLDELQSTLPSDRWRKVETAPEVGSILSYSYIDQTSEARIDLDLVAKPLSAEEYSYLVTIFAWPATGPRL